MNKRMLTLGVAAVCLALLVSCAQKPHVSLSDEYAKKTPQSTLAQAAAASIVVQDNAYQYAERIDPDMEIPRKIVTQIRDDMADIKESFTFVLQGDPDAIDTAMLRACYLLDISDIGFDSTYSQDDKTLDVKMKPIYFSSFKIRMWMKNPSLEDKLSEEDRQLYSKAKSIVDGLKLASADDTQKAIALHDYLIQNVVYPDDSEISEDSDRWHEAEGALIDGKAVCDGYADAYQLLLTIAGVKNIPIIGYSEGDAHAWNLLQVQGRWYHVDATWDDPVEQNDQTSPANYEYFLVSDSWMAQDHSWDMAVYPKADDNSLNPYVATGRTVDDYKQFVKLVTKSILKGEKDIVVYVQTYYHDDYPLDFVDLMVGDYYYQEPEEGHSGVFRIYIEDAQKKAS